MKLLPADITTVFALERAWPLPARERVALWLERGIFLAIIVAFFLNYFSLGFWAAKLLGGVMIGLAVWLLVALSIFYSRFHFARGLAVRHPSLPGVSWLVAEATAGSSSSRLINWLKSPVGQTVNRRLGFDSLALAGQLATAEQVGQPGASSVTGELTQFSTLGELAEWLLGAYPAYSEVMARRGLLGSQLKEAANWVELYEREAFRHQAWWQWEYLAEIPGLGKSWHYGETYLLEKYGRLIEVSPDRGQSSPFLPQSKKLEDILNRSREANAILVGDTDSVMATIETLAGRVKAGVTWPHLEGRRILMLETGRLLAEPAESLPQLLLKLATEAVRAGNVIVAVDNFPRLAAALGRAGSSLSTLLDSYLAGRALTMIGLTDEPSYHSTLEPDATLMNRFEVITIESPAMAGLLPALSAEVLALEAKTGLWFTYQAVEAVIDNAEMFFGEGTLLAESADLLDELTGYLLKRNIKTVTKEAVLDFIRQKTNIPVGEVRAEERDQLLNLENTLSRRVIGQELAIRGVAGALRRARAATRNTSRPIGTFLFLGPTGVGKTETAKALSAALFGREDALLRLDMSEFSSPGSLERLIGSFATGQAGILSQLVREQPYGVLLLDEFEKTHSEVQNLFLQILDEGFFSDMRGRRVNLRSLAIIATSNAGADLIWEIIGRGEDLGAKEKAIIDTLISHGTFRPELLNRFDATVLFKPLGAPELRKIAELMLTKLANRLKSKQGIKLELTPTLIEQVAVLGANQQFGARPMQRFIQETVEQLVADGLIAGQIKTGNRVSFVPLAMPASDNPLGLSLRVE